MRRIPSKHWMLCLAILAASASPIYAQHFHFGGGHSHGYGHSHGFGGYSSFGLGGLGYRSFGYSGYGGLGYGGFGFGYSPFAAARVGVYNTYYQSLGYGGLNYYNGPVGGYIAPPVYGYTGVGGGYYAPLYINPGYSDRVVAMPGNPFGAPGIGLNNPALFDERAIPGPQGLDPQILRDEPLEGVEPAVRVSNVEAKTRAIRFAAAGDDMFAKRSYMQAYTRYKQAVTSAPDMAEWRMRMAFALCAMNQPGSAAKEIKRALRLDPAVVSKSARLEVVFGGDAGGQVALNAMLQKLADWVREDIRDPDRLLVMGTVLFMNDDPDQGLPFLKSSAMLTGTEMYLKPFVKPAVRVAQPAVPAPPKAQPPEAEPVEPAAEPNAEPFVAPKLNGVEAPALKAPAAAGKRAGPLLPNGRFGDEQ